MTAQHVRDEPSGFAFSTKAETLERISGLVQRSRVPPLLFFTVERWGSERSRILAEIADKFSGKIAVRSSARNEDSHASAKAGYYTSLLDIDPSDGTSVADAIETVIRSYARDHEPDPQDQVLVQEQVTEAQLSGVAFTRDIDTGAPYYIINYDDETGRTDIITSGASSKGQKIFTYRKGTGRLPTDPLIATILRGLQEVEEITGLDALDIEFVIAHGELYLLQARPITTLKGIEFPQAEFDEAIEGVKRFLAGTFIPYPNLCGKTTAYGIMPDWNPAEIIGVNPRPLALTLYRYLITDDIWPLSRKQLGYRDVGHHPGIVDIAGKPYIDIRVSFNTFTPASIDRDLARKLVDFYITKLRRYQDYHDKVEFSVVHTCYRFDFGEAEAELLANGFFRNEVNAIKGHLLRLTDDILAERITSIDKELGEIDELSRHRERVMRSTLPALAKVAHLGADCRRHGTLPFSKLARFAFIGTAMMRSLVHVGAITQEECQATFEGLPTVATEFLQSLSALKREEITLPEFFEAAGHLRPGTYDITSRTYREAFEEYINLERFEPPAGMPNGTQRPLAASHARIEAALREHGLSVDAARFLEFTERAVIAREKAKFEFTKSLSLMLEILESHFSKHGITRDDLSFLDFDIGSLATASDMAGDIERLRLRIAQNRERYAITRSIRLPPLIFLERSVDYFRSAESTPNFVTHKTVCAPVVEASKAVMEDLKGKIVLVESADPGYDWIFSHDIAGLITEFGGANSHMAIRAAEFGLPAAIGCGTTLFSLIRSCERVELNCSTKQVKPIL